VEFGTGTLIIPKFEIGMTDFIPKNVDEELRDCLPYFERQTSDATPIMFATGAAFTNNDVIMYATFTKKRVNTPTVTLNNVSSFRLNGGTVENPIDSVVATIGSSFSMELDIAVAGTPLAIGDAYVLRSNNVNASIDIDAEF
jgi:hypothetical protein